MNANVLSHHNPFIKLVLVFRRKPGFSTSLKHCFSIMALAFATMIANAQVPTITSFSPQSAAPGTSITITGTNFNAMYFKNRIYFGDVAATPSSGSATSLVVTVPVGASYQQIRVTDVASRLTATSPNFFAPAFTPSLGTISNADIASKVDFGTAANPYNVTSGDIDGDGKPDLLVTNSGSDNFSVFRNTSTAGSVSFAAKVDIGTPAFGFPWGIAVGDVDGDGKLDVVVTNNVNDNVSFFRNLSTAGNISFSESIEVPTGENPISASIGDMDGDGLNDIMVVNAGNNRVAVIKNNGGTLGNISFSAATTYSVGAVPQSGVLVDIDKDGKLDIATANRTANTVSVLRNTSTPGNISYAIRIDFTTGTNPQYISAGDIDGDGSIDLAVANVNSNSFSILRNTSTSGAISFATKTDFNTGALTSPYAITLGDIDGNGKPDVLTANYLTNSVAVFSNTSSPGTVSFASKIDKITPLNPRSVTVADIDGDGRSDIATANIAVLYPTISVLRNTPVLKPSAANSPATAISKTGATLNGVVNANGLSTNVSFDFGTVSDLSTAATDPASTGGSAAAYAGNVNSSITLTNLTQGTTYYYRVRAVNSAGTTLATPISSFTTLSPPTITSFSPLNAAAGTTVTITGTNFTDATAVSFGGTAASSFTVVSPTSITAVVGTGTSGTVSVTTPSGTGTRIGYTFLTSNADLRAMGLSAGVMSPAFNSATTTYTTSVGNATTTMTITPLLRDETASVKVNGVTIPLYTSSSAIPLSVGSNTINTEVTAADGVTIKTYTITVTRAASANADLSGLVLSSGVFYPAFTSPTVTYSTAVHNSISSVTVTPTMADAGASIKVNGTAVPSGVASGTIPLIVGGTPISIVVTAANGSTTKTYTLTLTRAQSTDVNLSGLSLSSGTLSPAFTPLTVNYTAAVSNATTSVTATPTLYDAAGTLTVNGTAVTNGAASAPIALNVGPNTITTVVTAQNNTYTRTYTTTVTRAASTNANLSAFALSAGTLSPSFVAGTLTYTASVPNNRTSITITPTTADATAAIKVNGTTVTSGNATNAIALNVGTNTITTVVTAQDGTTTKTYTATITRAPSSEAGLSSYVVSAGTLSPVFDTGTLTYTTIVPNTTASVTITPTLTDATATVKVNNNTVTSGAASAAIALNVGTNVINTVVTAQDGSTIQTYTNTVTRIASGNANLSNIEVSRGSLSVDFAASILDYTVDVVNAVSSFTITPTSAHSGAIITINGTPVTSGNASATLALAVGANVFNIEVTSQNGLNKKTYVVTARRSPSAVASLSGLALSSGTLSPVFDASTSSYTASVINTTTSITVTPTLSDATATIKVNGTTVANGVASGAIALNIGTNVITTEVTAQDGTTVQTYTATVTRVASGNANLSNIEVSRGGLSVDFAASILDYTVDVVNAVSSFTITPTTVHSGATITINGTSVTSGNASATLALAVGSNVFKIEVTAQNGINKKTYVVTARRSPSAVASLSGLALSSGTLAPVFDASTQSYTTSVVNATASLTITPTLTDATATIKVNGTTVTNATASSAIALNVGTNVITTEVTAQDGTTTKTYTVTITRAASAEATLAGIALSSGTLSPAFDSATASYTASVSNSSTSLTLTPNLTDATGTIKVNGTTVANNTASGAIALNVGTNVINTEVTAQDGTTTKTYTITVTRAASAEATLAGIALSSGTLSPVFDSATASYTASVSNSSTSLTLTPNLTDATATIKVNGTTVANNTASGAISLNVGVYVITTEVTAQDGITTKTYTVTVTRAASAEATLAGIALSSGTLSPVFDSATASYTASVGNASTSLTLTPNLTDATATVKVNGTTVANATASGAIALNVGTNVITTEVTAQDGTTTKTYTVTITRAASAEATLAGITVSGTTLSPVFDPVVGTYTAAASNSTASVTVTPNLTDATATVKVNGVVVNNGVASGAVALNVGTNVITTEVTAQDGITTKTYTVTVTRAASADATLAGITVSGTTLSPVFDPAIGTYTASASNSTASVTVTPNLTDATATVKVNRVVVANGAESSAISLNVGANVITTEVTAQDGTTTKTYTVTVTRAASAEATLAGIALSSGTLSPVFDSATASYTASVGNASTSLTLTPNLTDATATIKVNGTTVTNATASGAIALNVGTNVITTEVTAQNGTATKTYTVTVTRAASADATLAGITVSGATLSPVFDPAVGTYTASASNSTASVTVTPNLTDATATVKVNGVVVNNAAASGAIALNVGTNVIITEVTAQDGTTTKTYTVTVTRAASAEATLAGIALSSGTLSPAFDSATASYTASVGNASTSLTLTPNLTDATATIKVNGTTVANATASGAIALNVGTNVITTEVTAQDGITTKTYTVTVTRAASADATLAGITVSGATLSPVFDPAVGTYTASASNSTASVTVTPNLTDATATVKVNGVVVNNAAASGAIALNVGTNVIITEVTAQDGTTTKTYTVTVTRAASAEATLAGIALSSGTLSPIFDSATASYTASVGNTSTSLTLTPNLTDATATIKVNGTTVANNTASSVIALNVGANVITTEVTAQDGITTKTYTVTVTRAASADATLAGITVSGATLSPVFDPAVGTYTASTSNSTASVTVIPNLTDATATVKVNGVVVANGVASGAVALNVGTNVITTEVTAQDGTTTKTYTVTVTRAASAEATLSGIALSSGTLSPAFDSATASYTASVSNSSTSLTLTPNLTDATATIKVNGTTVANNTASGAIALNVGTNVITTEVTAQDGTTTKTYTVTVTRAASADATLAGITVSGTTLSPVFDPAVGTYTASTSNSTASVTVTPNLTDATATVKVNGTTVANATASGAIALNVGTNVITTEVTAQDGTTTKTYTVTITRASSAEATLAGITVSGTTLSPVFDPAIGTYTASASNSTASVTVTPNLTDATATVKVNGVVVNNGVASGASSLNVGTNVITTEVTAQDGITTKTYTVTVTRAASAEATLAGIALSSGTLSPVFDSATASYTASVGSASNSLTLTPNLTDVTATIKVNGTTVANNTASGAITLNAGTNVITTEVTAQDGTTTKTYTVTVTRAASSEATLAGISLSIGTLSPAFDSNTLNYTATVGADVSTIAIGASGSNTNSSIAVNGETVSNGSLANVVLKQGVNLITIAVTAQDGSVKTYSIAVTKPSAPLQAQTISFEALATKIYGDAPFSPGAISSSGLNIIYTSSDEKVIKIQDGKALITGAGKAAITAKQDGNNLFDAASPVVQEIVINKAILTVKAMDKIKLENQENPELELSISGFVNGEVMQAMPEKPVAVTTATKSSVPGIYPIKVQGGWMTNYSMIYVDGSLLVKQSATGNPAKPVNIILSKYDVYENNKVGTVVGVITTSEPNLGSTFSYSLAGSDAISDADNVAANPGINPFSIMNDKLVASMSFDYETQNTYSVKIKTTDATGASFEKVVTINVLDVNEAPTMNLINSVVTCYNPVEQVIALSGITAGPEKSQLTELSISTESTLFNDLKIVAEGTAGGNILYTLKPNQWGTATIRVKVKDNGGTANDGVDELTQVFTITVNQPAQAVITATKTTVKKGESVILTASGGVSYEWQTAPGIINGSRSSMLTVSPTENTVYTVTAYNAAGCTSTKSIMITLDESPKTVSATNLLSPNNDGKNDFFVIKDIELYPRNTVTIFDRGGRVIYKKVKYQNEWDGTLNGLPLSQDTYYYVVDLGDGTPSTKGFISIVRNN